MPLPLALLSRLQKRGIVKAEPETEEEVIAENYDDEDEGNDISDQQNQISAEDVNEPILGCPNKWNIYHDCTAYCLETWGNGRLQPSPKMEKKRLRMLKNYPLPDGWEEIYDPGTGRFYYWSIISGEVSWLPPDHPRSQLCMPAHSLRTLLKNGMPLPAQYIPMPMEEDREPSESDEEEEDDDDDEEEEEEVEEEDEDEVELRGADKEKHSSRDEQHSNSRGREKVRGNDLDPMDPAAYSEAPRGTWSSGLDRKGEAKTGADTTASGPLYQMRPYPSPGAVLRLNATLKQGYSEESESEEDD